MSCRAGFRGLSPTVWPAPCGSSRHAAPRCAAGRSGLSRPQPSNDIGGLPELSEQVSDQVLGLGPQGVGLATGLLSRRSGLAVSQIRTVPSPEPDTRLVPSGLKAREKT